MTAQQDKIDNLLIVSKTRKIFHWEQYSIKDLRMFLEQSVDIVNNEENRIKYSTPNIFQQNYVNAQETMRKKITKINIKYEKLLTPPSFSS